MADDKGGYGYGKRPMWHWIVLYLVIGGLVYWAIYAWYMKKNTNSGTGGLYGSTSSGSSSLYGTK